MANIILVIHLLNDELLFDGATRCGSMIMEVVVQSSVAVIKISSIFRWMVMGDG